MGNLITGKCKGSIYSVGTVNRPDYSYLQTLDDKIVGIHYYFNT